MVQTTADLDDWGASARSFFVADGQMPLNSDEKKNTGQWVAFAVGQQIFGVDILSVREIRAWTGATQLPGSGEYVRGVINLRGSIVPIIDLSCRFGGGLAEATMAHVVVIVFVSGKLVGLLVDSVSDIVEAAADAVLPVPEVRGSSRARFLAGLLTHDEQMIALLALDEIVDDGAIPEPA
jgi:purine-binding chemotaxis protein CheW